MQKVWAEITAYFSSISVVGFCVQKKSWMLTFKVGSPDLIFWYDPNTLLVWHLCQTKEIWVKVSIKYYPFPSAAS